MNYAVFNLTMEGGSGMRFWQQSRNIKPGQFPSVFDNETLIQSTIYRFSTVIPGVNINIVSKQSSKYEILKQNLTFKD